MKAFLVGVVPLYMYIYKYQLHFWLQMLCGIMQVHKVVAALIINQIKVVPVLYDTPFSYLNNEPDINMLCLGGCSASHRICQSTKLSPP